MKPYKTYLIPILDRKKIQWRRHKKKKLKKKKRFNILGSFSYKRQTLLHQKSQISLLKLDTLIHTHSLMHTYTHIK